MQEKLDEWTMMKDFFHRHRNKMIGLISTAGVFLVLIIFSDKIFMPLYTHRGAELELPDVTEKSFEEAAFILEDQKLQIVIDTLQFSSFYPESTVIQQDPPPFTRVKRGRRIYVTLSAGERQIEVPRVIGLSERDATFALYNAGLVVGEIYYEFSNYYPQGVVFVQSLKDTLVPEKTFVDITISNGRLPTEFVVPKLAGLPLKKATTDLRKAGLRLGQIRYRENDNLVPDTVLEQSPASGTKVPRGTRVHVIVSMLRGSYWDETGTPPSLQ